MSVPTRVQLNNNNIQFLQMWKGAMDMRRKCRLAQCRTVKPTLVVFIYKKTNNNNKKPNLGNLNKCCLCKLDNPQIYKSNTQCGGKQKREGGWMDGGSGLVCSWSLTTASVVCNCTCVFYYLESYFLRLFIEICLCVCWWACVSMCMSFFFVLGTQKIYAN